MHKVFYGPRIVSQIGLVKSNSSNAATEKWVLFFSDMVEYPSAPPNLSRLNKLWNFNFPNFMHSFSFQMRADGLYPGWWGEGGRERGFNSISNLQKGYAILSKNIKIWPERFKLRS